MRWSKTLKERTKVIILACIVSVSGTFFQEFRMDKDIKWKPWSIFVVKDTIYVVYVRGSLNKSLLG